MKETRTINISGRVFSLKDIKNIASVFDLGYKNAARHTSRCSLSFCIIFDDNSKYESEDITIFEKPLFNSKKAEVIEFEFYNFESKDRIKLELRNGDSEYYNRLVVSGENSDWVNSRVVELQQLIAGSKPQSTFLKIFYLPLFIFFALTLGIFFFYCMSFFIWLTGLGDFQNILSRLDEDLKLLPAFFVAGAIPAILLLSYLKTLWPNIEIQVGPSHTFKEKNRRTILGSIFTLVLLPILIGLFFP